MGKRLLPGIIRLVSSWSKPSNLIAFAGYQHWGSEPGGGLYRPETNEIVLVWEYKREEGLYVMDANGAKRRLLFKSQSFVHPDWSPDARHIALTVSARTHLGAAEDSDRLYLVESDGSNPRLVFHSTNWVHRLALIVSSGSVSR